MPDLLILKHVHSSVPCISCDGTVRGGTDGILVAFNGVYHQTVEHLVGTADGLHARC